MPDFRLNKKFDQLNQMNTQQKEKVEFLLYYMTRPEYQIHVRENIWIICWIFFEEEVQKLLGQYPYIECRKEHQETGALSWFL